MIKEHLKKLWIEVVKLFAYESPKKSYIHDKPVKKYQPKQKKNVANKKTVSYHRIFNVSGVTFDCALGVGERQYVLRRCKMKDKLYLKEFEYKGEPAYYIVREKENLDIGCVPADIVPIIEKYKDRNYEVIFNKLDLIEKEDDYINYAKVQFIVYKD